MAAPLSVNEGLLVQRYREAIIRGQFKPGHVLVFAGEAARLGVSRGVIRRAMHSLASQGLVELGEGETATVRPLTINSLQDLEYTLTRRRA